MLKAVPFCSKDALVLEIMLTLRLLLGVPALGQEQLIDGLISSVNVSDSSITVKSNGKQTTYRLATQTSIRVGGEVRNISQLQVGMQRRSSTMPSWSESPRLRSRLVITMQVPESYLLLCSAWALMVNTAWHYLVVVWPD